MNRGLMIKDAHHKLLTWYGNNENITDLQDLFDYPETNQDIELTPKMISDVIEKICEKITDILLNDGALKMKQLTDLYRIRGNLEMLQLMTLQSIEDYQTGLFINFYC